MFELRGVLQIKDVGQSQEMAAGSAKIPKVGEDRDSLNHNAYVSRISSWCFWVWQQVDHQFRGQLLFYTDRCTSSILHTLLRQLVRAHFQTVSVTRHTMSNNSCFHRWSHGIKQNKISSMKMQWWCLRYYHSKRCCCCATYSQPDEEISFERRPQIKCIIIIINNKSLCNKTPNANASGC